jgi:branched-chain amino acid transport system permease protein
MNRFTPFIPFILTAVILAFAPKYFSSGTSLTVMSLMGIMIIFALSYNLLLGQTGLLSFGHAVYYGLAGFVAIHLMNVIIKEKLPIPLPLVPLLGGFAGLFFGIIFGWLSTKRAGTVFSMISLGLAELVAASVLVLRTFFGGEEGITTNRSKLMPFFGYKFGPQIEVYYLIAFWCMIVIIVMYALTRTPLGRMCNAVRENPERAEFVGYSTQTVRFFAFCQSAFFAGIAGGLAALNFEIMNVQSVGAQLSGSVLLMTFVGGAGVYFGPVIGAIFVTLLQISLSDITGAWQLYFGLMFVGIVMYAPGGIAGFVVQHFPIIRAGLIGRLVPSYLLILIPAALVFIGLSCLIELSHHALVKASFEGPDFHAFGQAFNTRSPLVWGTSVVIVVVGLGLGRLIWPRVANAWGNVQTVLAGRNA